MGFRCGIVGLPNVGKSTVFNALSNAASAVAPYPFCTIEAKKGVVSVPDERLDKVYELLGEGKEKVPTHIEFVDIAGLMKGASHGEGLGNQFLANIRDVDTILHVVRCFESGEIAHILGEIDPARDIEVINLELQIKDLETVTKNIEKASKTARTGDKESKAEVAALTKVKDGLDKGTAARNIELTKDEKEIIKPLGLLTMKPVFYLANVGETDLPDGGDCVGKIKEIAARENSEVVTLAGSFEADLAGMGESEAVDFLKEYGLKESGLKRLVRAGYELLDIVTFYTTDGPEVRAWTVTKGTKAPEAAGKIHTDFEKGFIRAEVVHYEDLADEGSIHAAREKGHLLTEGKDYVVRDGDIIHFKN